jgi:hypothetical protein
VGTFSKTEADELYQKKMVTLSGIHPDSGEVVPWFARTSAFMPTNLPIIGAMMLAAPTPFNTIFWQWVNQTYNAGFNYGNRNASSTTTVSQLLQSYALAVTASISAAMTLRKITGLVLGGRTGAAVTVANSIVNYGAVGFSSSLNVYFMRSGEIASGISVMDPETNEVVGTSKIAAETAIKQTINCRFAYLVPIFFTQPILEAMLRKVGMFPKKAGAFKMIVDLTLISIGLWIAIPVCCSIYPQYSKISIKDLEEDVRTKVNPKHDHLLYNKGL